MAVITLTAASNPAIANTLLKTAGTSNGNNSAGWTYAGGVGAADTIANAEFLKGLPTKCRLRTFFETIFATQLELDAAVAALGVNISTNGGTLVRLITAAPGVPTATITGTIATGSLRISLGSSEAL